MRPLALAVLMLCGCAHLITDRHGNSFRSEKEMAEWHQKHPDAADFVGRPLKDASALWGLPDRHMVLAGADTYEWGDMGESTDRSLFHVDFSCGRRVTVDSGGVILTAMARGRCH